VFWSSGFSGKTFFKMVGYRVAGLGDLEKIKEFVDFWLSGRGKRVGTPGAVDDCFVSVGQHKAYLRRYLVVVALEDDKIVGWGVKTMKGVLLHLLVAGDHRGQGIGGELLRIMEPWSVRSKIDQSTGDPTGWYKKKGYTVCGTECVGRNKNIKVLRRE